MKRINCVYQNVPNECAACCVLMILKYYGYIESLYFIRKELGVGRNGVKVGAIKDFFVNNGFEVHVYKSNLAGLKSLSTPLIITWGENHYVILKKIKNKYIEIIDPLCGSRQVEIKEFSEKFSGYLVSVIDLKIANGLHKNNKSNKGILSKLNVRPILFGVILLNFITYIFSLFQPYIVEYIIDSFKIEYAIDIYIFILALIYFGITILTEQKKITIGNKLYLNIAKKTIHQTLKLPYKIFQDYTSGDIIFRINCLNIIREIYYILIPEVFCNLIICIIILITIVLYSKTIAQIIILILAVLAIIMQFVIRKIKVLNNEAVNAENELNALTNEFVNAIREIKVTGLENTIENNWYNKFSLSNSVIMKREKFHSLYSVISNFIFILGPIIILIYGMKSVFLEEITIGKVMACYSLSSILFSSLASIFVGYYSITNEQRYLDKIEELLEIDDKEIKLKAMEYQIPKNWNIEVGKLNYRYTKYEDMTLHNINIRIDQGKYVAIIGESGSGKSTLLKLLLGLYNNYDGNITIGGYNICHIDKRLISSKIGVVSQEIMLLNKSIYENIILGNTNVSKQSVQEVCKIVQLDRDIKLMHMGYSTIIHGDNFSGGQKQRIAIARALIKNPEIIIFDEATSFLDTKTEMAIMNYLKQLSCTRIVITHHIESVKDADYIYYGFW